MPTNPLRNRLILVATLLLCALAAAQRPSETAFDRYVMSVKSHRPQPRFVTAARACGLALKHSHANYATSNGGSFERTHDFVKGVYSLESDFFSTAALWIQGGHPLLIDFWSIDDSEGSESDSIICLDQRGHATEMQITNWYVPIEQGFPGWRYKRLVRFDSEGKVINDVSRFEDLTSGRQIAKPQVDSDQESGLRWFPGQDLVREVVTQLADRKKTNAAQE